MNTIRNSYFLSTVAVDLRAGPNPSVTIIFSRLQVDELAYRTSPSRRELVSRHVSKVDDVEVIPVDRPMLDRIRGAMSLLSHAIRDNSGTFIQQNTSGSNWFFQPKQDGWLAMCNGQPKDVRAFQQWLCNSLASTR